MKSMEAPEEKASSQESASTQARTRFSGKGIVLVVLLCAVAMALTALAVINNPSLSTIADNPNPMASGENEESENLVIDKGYDYEEPCVGTSNVAYYAMEGGTLVFDPDDDASMGVKCDPICIDEDGNIIEMPSASGPQFSSNAKKGLKEYKTTVAVNPTVCYGSITAVPDPGYVFVSWNEGVNYSPKLYLWGAMSGTATAYFEKMPEPIAAEPIDYEEPCVGTSKVKYYATEGGTLTFDPDDDASIRWVEDCSVVYDESGNKIEIPSTSSPRVSANAKTGLKEYITDVAVNPTVCFGSITAVPDPGYTFVSWNNGENYSSKLYLWGAMSGTATAYFEKASESADPIKSVLEEPVYPDIESKIEADIIDDDENAKDDSIFRFPTMSVYAQNALDGNVTLAQGKSTSLNGFATLAEIDYAGAITGKVKYESSNAAIATVDGLGKVTASKKKTGTAKITVFSVDNPSCKKVVTVKVVKKSSYKAVKAITKLNLKKQYKANAKKQIAVKVTGWNPKAPSNKDFVVSVAPATKASVDPATNKVTFKAKGTVKVTVASAENPKIKKTVTVKVK